MKLSSETLQNMLYFWNKKTQQFYSFLILSIFGFLTMDALPAWSLCNVHALLQIQNCSKWKTEKKLLEFSYSRNMANFEVFRQTILSSINLLFLKTVIVWPICNFFFSDKLRKFTVSDFPNKQTHFGHILRHCFSANGLSYCSQHKNILLKCGSIRGCRKKIK